MMLSFSLFKDADWSTLFFCFPHETIKKIVIMRRTILEKCIMEKYFIGQLLKV